MIYRHRYLFWLKYSFEWNLYTNIECWRCINIEYLKNKKTTILCPFSIILSSSFESCCDLFSKNNYIDYFKSNTEQAQLKKTAFVALKIALRTDK